MVPDRFRDGNPSWFKILVVAQDCTYICQLWIDGEGKSVGWSRVTLGVCDRTGATTISPEKFELMWNLTTGEPAPKVDTMV